MAPRGLLSSAVVLPLISVQLLKNVSGLSNSGQLLSWSFRDDRAVKVARVYSGSRRRDGTTLVSVNGRPLDPRPNFRSQSATTFDWGYEGRGGPAQLALAILADHFADDEKARRHYEDFTRRVIRGLLQESWLLTGAEIDAVYPEGTAKAQGARQPMSIPCEPATAAAPDAGEAAGRDPSMIQREKETV